MSSLSLASLAHISRAARLRRAPKCAQEQQQQAAEEESGSTVCEVEALPFSTMLRTLLLLALGALAPSGVSAVDPCFDASCIGPAQKSQLVNRPQLLPYEPVAAAEAVVVASDKMARFTVLTDHLIRMEYARVANQFEDRASLAVLNRKLPVPKFSHAESGGVLTITTAAVKLSYTVGKGFTPATLSAQPTAEEAKDPLGFPGWKFGDANPGNLLGTVRGQDGQSATDLNCTLNRAVDGECPNSVVCRVAESVC